MKVSQLRLTKKKQLFDGLKLLLFSALLLIFPNPVKALTRSPTS
jgi:hypothetical protein